MPLIQKLVVCLLFDSFGGICVCCSWYGRTKRSKLHFCCIPSCKIDIRLDI